MRTIFKLTAPLLTTPLLLLLSATSVFGQIENAEVLGTVRDPAGSGIPRAALSLKNQNTGIEAKSSTDETGNYDFFNVKVGLYTVTVEAAGFSKVSATDVAVAVGSRQRVDIPSVRILMQTIAKQGKIPAERAKDVDGWMAQYIDYSFLDRAEKSLGLAK